MRYSPVKAFLCICWLAATVLLTGCGGTGQAPASQKVELTISAAVSLKDALADIEKSYQAKHPNVKLIFNLGASGALARQIEQGAPVDVFIAAASQQMDELAAKNLIDKTSHLNVAENRLVLVVPVGAAKPPATFADIADSQVAKIALGEPATVPAGQYGRQVLQKLGLWAKVENKLVFAKDVRTVLTYVETGNAEAGLVYATDAAASAKVKVAAMAPADAHQPIVYPAALVAGSKSPKAAAEFLAYLTSADGQAILSKYGFIPARR